MARRKRSRLGGKQDEVKEHQQEDGDNVSRGVWYRVWMTFCK